MRYLIISLILLSCNPTKKLDKINKKYPEIVAKYCYDKFPCVTTKIDTVTNTEYDFVELQCPGYESAIKDTIWLTKTNTKIVKGPKVIVTEQHTNTIIKKIKDSAEITACKINLLTCKNNCAKLQHKVTSRNSAIMWLIIALLLSIIINIILIKKW